MNPPTGSLHIQGADTLHGSLVPSADLTFARGDKDVELLLGSCVIFFSTSLPGFICSAELTLYHYREPQWECAVFY